MDQIKQEILIELKTVRNVFIFIFAFSAWLWHD